MSAKSADGYGYVYANHYQVWNEWQKKLELMTSVTFAPWKIFKRGEGYM